MGGEKKERKKREERKREKPVPFASTTTLRSTPFLCRRATLYRVRALPYAVSLLRHHYPTYAPASTLFFICQSQM